MERDLTHNFSVSDAVRLKSIEKAVIISNLRFWITHNKANNTHLYDGYYWTYNSMKAYTKLFPYLNEKKLYYLFNQLQEAGEIKTGNFNKSGYNRTKWYTLPAEFKAVEDNENKEEKEILKCTECISQNWEMECPKLGNGISKSGNCIYNTDIKPDIKPEKEEEKKSSLSLNEQIFEVFEKAFKQNTNHYYTPSPYQKEHDSAAISKHLHIVIRNHPEYETDSILEHIRVFYNRCFSQTKNKENLNPQSAFISMADIQAPTAPENVNKDVTFEDVEQLLSDPQFVEDVQRLCDITKDKTKELLAEFKTEREIIQDYKEMSKMELRKYCINTLKLRSKKNGKASETETKEFKTFSRRNKR